MKTSLRQKVFNLLDEGKAKEEILNILGEENRTVIVTYIRRYKKENEELNDTYKHIFLDLEKGLSRDEICFKYNINMLTLKNTYERIYRKIFNITAKKIIFSELNFAHDFYGEKKQHIQNKLNEEKTKNKITLSINENKYDIEFYILDENIWLNFIEILNMLKKENINFDKDEININERYLANIKVNNEPTTIIDKNILLNFANDIGDHKFIKSALDLTLTNKNIFYKISYIVDAINLISDLVKEYIETGNSKLKVFEKLEQDILHHMENSELSDDKLLEEAKKIKSVRVKRREVKNVFVLSGKIKNILFENGSHSNALQDIAKRIDKISDDLYNKKYICRSDLTEEEKKEFTDENY